MAEVIPFPSKCARCRDARWICERHPDQPHAHDGCTHAGMPCPYCNTKPKPDLPKGWNSLLDD